MPHRSLQFIMSGAKPSISPRLIPPCFPSEWIAPSNVPRAPDSNWGEIPNSPFLPLTLTKSCAFFSFVSQLCPLLSIYTTTALVQGTKVSPPNAASSLPTPSSQPRPFSTNLHTDSKENVPKNECNDGTFLLKVEWPPYCPQIFLTAALEIIYIP